MTPDQQLNKIIEHLSSLEDVTLELNNSIVELSSLHSSLQSSDNTNHQDVAIQVSDIHSTLSDHMVHTEQMVTNLLHPDRFEHLTYFMKVMDDAMNGGVEEE